MRKHMSNWHSWNQYNRGYQNEREFKRSMEGKYFVETRSTYTEEEYYQKILDYEQKESISIQRRMDRRDKKLKQIQEIIKK